RLAVGVAGGVVLVVLGVDRDRVGVAAAGGVARRDRLALGEHPGLARLQQTVAVITREGVVAGQDVPRLVIDERGESERVKGARRAGVGQGVGVGDRAAGLRHRRRTDRLDD